MINVTRVFAVRDSASSGGQREAESNVSFEYSGVGKSRFTVVSTQSRVHSCIISYLLILVLFIIIINLLLPPLCTQVVLSHYHKTPLDLAAVRLWPKERVIQCSCDPLRAARKCPDVAVLSHFS